LNFLGMGMFELAAIFLVAFLVLGPIKSVEMARAAGKVLGDLRRTFNEVVAATTLDVEDLNVSDPKTSGGAPTGSGSQPEDSPSDSSNDSPGDSNGAGRP
jgi:Sec-independent protein translocase protein TatA